MSIPPIKGPKLPPKIDKPVVNPNECIIHKGPFEGDIYTCKCGAKMCVKCALKRKNQENKPSCPICTAFLFVSEKK
jgi:hypothetical protein